MNILRNSYMDKYLYVHSWTNLVPFYPLVGRAMEKWEQETLMRVDVTEVGCDCFENHPRFYLIYFICISPTDTKKKSIIK